jgi:dinuclear metal center YbgI/SA1388 family protein
MHLKVKDIHRIIEKYAPEKLKEDYDNVGLMVGDMESQVTSILVSLDCTLDVIKEAEDKNCNLIFTHHPLLFSRPKSITTDTLIGKKIIRLIKNGINVYSSHTNLDSAPGGMNDIIMDILGLYNASIIEPKSNMDSYFNSNSGIGRFVELEGNVTLGDICRKVKEKLALSHVRYTGNDTAVIRKIAVINGSGKDYFQEAKRLGCDCIITGDTTYHYVSDFNEEGVAVIDAGHFGTEWPSMAKISDFLQEKIEKMGFENRVILSKCNKDPYKYK